MWNLWIPKFPDSQDFIPPKYRVSYQVCNIKVEFRIWIWKREFDLKLMHERRVFDRWKKKVKKFWICNLKLHLKGLVFTKTTLMSSLYPNSIFSKASLWEKEDIIRASIVKKRKLFLRFLQRKESCSLDFVLIGSGRKASFQLCVSEAKRKFLPLLLYTL